jgi:hypothetical protein
MSLENAYPASRNKVDLLESSLMDFYSRRENAEKILPIIKRTSPVSLRLLDFFVVVFSRYNNVVYRLDDKYVDVHNSYKAQLKNFSKRNFDPFRRSGKRSWNLANEKRETTLGQLCFLKWVIGMGIIEYVEANLTRISQAMKEHLSRAALQPGSDQNEGDQKTKRKLSRKRSGGLVVTATRARATVGDRWVIQFD